MRGMTVRMVLGLCLLAGTASMASAQALDEESVSRLSADQKLEAARQARTQIADIADRVLEMRQSAGTTEEDATKVRCLNEAATSINGFLQVANRAFGNLQGAVDSGDISSMNHEYIMVMVSRQRVAALDAQAQQCAGHALRHVGDTQRTVTVDPDMADFDSTLIDADSGGAFFFVEGLAARTSAER